MQNFRRLRVWEDSQEIAVETYRITSGFPSEERFGLASQMRRAAVSISSNIAEGAGRTGPREMAYHLSVAAGSASEVDSQMELAARLGFVEGRDALQFHNSIAKLRKAIFTLRHTVIGDSE